METYTLILPDNTNQQLSLELDEVAAGHLWVKDNYGKEWYVLLQQNNILIAVEEPDTDPRYPKQRIADAGL